MNKTKNPLIFITGGHITPAIAVIDEIRRVHPNWDMMCIGRRYNLERSTIESAERRLVEEKGVPFLPIIAGRLARSGGVAGITSLLKIPVGFATAFIYLMRYRPNAVVSFGGYIALPVSLAAFFLGIPVITHEQTRIVGLANKIIGRLARKICITFPDTIVQFPKEKTVITGLPLRRELFSPPTEAPISIPSGPLLYITGGSTGAVSMNDRIFPCIGKLTDTYTIIHQTGRQSLARAEEVEAALPESKRQRYVVKDFVNVEELSWIYKNAKGIIGRSGANTVVEADTLGKPMVCVPLPWSGGGEQRRNAQWLAERGLGYILEQHALTGDTLVSALNSLFSAKKKDAPRKSLPAVQEGASRVVQEISVILGA